MVAKLTSRQIDVLGIVGEQGPVTARDVGEYHLPIGASSARSVLNALERKNFVSAVYTGSGVSMRARSYQITNAGREALTAALTEFEQGDDFHEFMERATERRRRRAEHNAKPTGKEG